MPIYTRHSSRQALEKNGSRHLLCHLAWEMYERISWRKYGVFNNSKGDITRISKLVQGVTGVRVSNT
jgi:hypothetical protein